MANSTIQCTKCGKFFVHNSDNFHVHSKDPLRYRKICKVCERNRVRKYKKNNRQKVLEGKKKHYQKNKDKILKYAKKYREQEYVKKHRKEWFKQCSQTDDYKQKHKERNKKYLSKPGNRDNVRKKIRECRKKKYYENIEESRKKAREYSKTEKAKATARAYYKKTKTPQNKLRNCVRVAIYKFLKKNNGKKNSSILKYLPYTFDDLKEHIESQFEPWMNWDNWGVYNTSTWDDNDPNTWTWQIDHIKRHKEFNYNSLEHPDFAKCWSLENLRPLSAKENVQRQ